MTDRELLTQLAQFIVTRDFIEADEKTIRDMVTRYTAPPLTLHRRVAMRMTVNDYNILNTLLLKINEHLKPIEVDEDSIEHAS